MRNGPQVTGTESARTNVYTAMVDNGAANEDGKAPRWWVLHTKPRAEKAVAGALEKQAIEFYLPLVAIQHTYAKSRATFHKPLFPGYVFLLGDSDARLVALQTNKLVSALSVPDQTLFEREIGNIRRALASGEPLSVFPALRAGARFRVTSGPLRDVEGVIERIGSQARIYASVSVLGQSVTLEIDPALLERID
ncbi:MAG: hypothetical protein AMXMBFR47_14520 [Planctomycetota bacterium]